ncbi:MAG: VraH family protein [Staphylococcus epidermidis]|nr:VraH family protein [Staphylococcus epidermidis]
MSVKNVLKQSWEDLKNLELNFKNVSIVVVVTFILSNILTPLAGILVGLLGSAYWIQNRKRKQS